MDMGATTNNVKISFWQPVVRDRAPEHPDRYLLEVFYDRVIDPLFTSPFASNVFVLSQTTTRYWDFTLLRTDPLKTRDKVIRAVVVIVGLIFYRRTTALLLTLGLVIKASVRSKESYYLLPISTGPQSSQPSPLTRAEIQERNVLLWFQKWWCDAMYFLFAMGYSDTVTIPQPVPANTEQIIEVMIGNESIKYPLSFLNALPFFRMLMSSGMKDFKEGKIYLSKDFPYKHQDLQVLQNRLQDADATQWGKLEEFEFLCLGERNKEASHVMKFGEIQRIILAKDYKALPSWSFDHPPGVKVCSYTPNFLPEIFEPKLDFEGKSLTGAVEYAKNCLDKAVKQKSDVEQHYHVNRVIHEFIHYLYASKTSGPVLTDLITPLLNLFEQCKEVPTYLTVLDLPETSLVNSEGTPLLPLLLNSCPNLKWLALESFISKFCIESNLVPHENLRVLKINGQTLTPEQEKELRKNLFKNLDILEAKW